MSDNEKKPADDITMMFRMGALLICASALGKFAWDLLKHDFIMARWAWSLMLVCGLTGLALLALGLVSTLVEWMQGLRKQS